MPRPLIIKIENSMNHLSDPIKTPVDNNFSKTTSKSLPKLNTLPSNMIHTNSLVRNLINMFEDQSFSKSNLIKSKSLPYIAPSQTLTVANFENVSSDETPVETNNHFNQGTSNFQSVWKKFESSSSSEVQKTKTIRRTQSCTSDLKDIQEKAGVILEDYARVPNSVWKAQVLSFLKMILSVDDNTVVHTNVNHSAEVKKEVKNEEHEQHIVKTMTNFFESENSTEYSIPTTPKMFNQYFTGVNNNHENNDDSADGESSSSESSLSDSNHSQGSYKNLSPGMKIFELKSYFESKKDTTTEKSETFEHKQEVNDTDSEEEEKPKEPREIIKELKEEIEHYKKEIEEISKEDIDKGSQINEELIQILIKLDDIFSKNEEIRAERKEAIAFVQKCIRMLRDKMRN